MSTDLTVPHASPFDAIRRTRDDDTEFWSARDLQPFMGYSKWQDFQNAIERAKVAAANAGHEAISMFTQISQLMDAGNLGEQQRVDYELTRFACYLTFLNGDPRKPEVAAAQAYFAIRTREAETSTSVVVLPSKRELALMVIEAEDRADREAAARIDAERHAAELAPSAAAWDELGSAGADYAIDDAAKVLSRDPNINIGKLRLFAYMAGLGWTYRGHRSRWRAYQSQVNLGRLAEKVGRPYWCPDLKKMVTPEPTVRITSKGLSDLYQKLGGGTQLELEPSL